MTHTLDGQNDTQTGRPHSIRMPETIDKGHQLVTSDRRLTNRELANELKISKDVVWQVLTQELGKRKDCSPVKRFLSQQDVVEMQHFHTLLT